MALGDLGSSSATVARLLHRMGYSLRVNHKKISTDHSPDRNDQFLYLGDLRDRFQRRGHPTISVDTKKRELVGDFNSAIKVRPLRPYPWAGGLRRVWRERQTSEVCCGCRLVWPIAGRGKGPATLDFVCIPAVRRFAWQPAQLSRSSTVSVGVSVTGAKTGHLVSGHVARCRRNPLRYHVLSRKQRTSACPCHVGGRGFKPRRPRDSLAVGK